MARTGWIALVGLGLLACGTTGPRFGSLTADSRNLNVANHLTMFEISNGMTVALASDPRTNLVSVDMRYDVGAAQDPMGRVGLAHLVEHLSFQAPSGTQGATIFDKLTSLSFYFNAYTNADVTHYTSIALADRIDALLELEAQRLEQRCDQVPEASFVRERDVVLEEEAERTTAISTVADAIAVEVWGLGHPYARPIGSREVATATKAEACAFFDAYYVPKRATLVVTGNFNAAALQPRIGQRFGRIARAPTGVSTDVAPAHLDGTTSEHRADVDRAMALIYLPAPAWGADDEPAHDTLMLALRWRLASLDDAQPWLVSTSVGYSGAGHQRVTVIGLEVSDPAKLDAAVDAALAAGRGLFQDDDNDGNYDDDDDADDREVRRQFGLLRGRQQTATVTQADRFWGHGDWLADFLTYTTHHEFMLAHMRGVDELKVTGLVARAKSLFNRDQAHVALIRPSGAPTEAARTLVASSAKDYDLPAWRVAIDPAEAARPASMPRGAAPLAIDDYRLANGMRVLMSLDPTSPLVDARLVYPAGQIDDAPDHRGIAELAAVLLDHDYDREYPGRVVDKLNWATGLGTQLDADVDRSSTVFSARGLAIFGDWHVWRLSWLLDQGVYRSQAMTSVRRDLAERGDDERSAARIELAHRLFGKDHPYAAEPPSIAQLTAISAGQLAGWKRARYATEGATLIVTGGFDRAKMRRTIDELFGPWSKSTPAPHRPMPPPQPAPGPGWIGIRDGNAPQVRLAIAFTSASDVGRDRAARLVLAAMITDRLRIVREGLGASYGVDAGYGGPGSAALSIDTALDPVRAPKAAAAILAELTAVRTGAATMAADFARARRRVLGDLLATATDATSVANSLEAMVKDGGDLDQLRGLATAVAQTTPAAVAAVAAVDLDPARMVVSVGGRVEPAKATLASLGAADIDWFDE